MFNTIQKTYTASQMINRLLESYYSLSERDADYARKADTAFESAAIIAWVADDPELIGKVDRVIDEEFNWQQWEGDTSEDLGW